MENWQAKDFIEYIDSKYHEAKKNRLSRMSIEWGQWSREMNVVLRDRINSKQDLQELRLKHVIVYWTLISKLLELWHKSTVMFRIKGTKIRKEANEHKDAILTGKGLKEFELNADFYKKMMK